MLKFLLAVSFCIGSVNAYADNYVDRELGITLAIPINAKVVKGNFLKGRSIEEEQAFIKVFETSENQIEEVLNSTIFTVGYFSGPIENGPDAAITASAVKVEKGKVDQVKQFTNELIKREEKENEFMAFKFFEKAKEVQISHHKFLVSRGVLEIKINGQVAFSMPIFYYVSKIKNHIGLFSLSGEEGKLKSLENSLLSLRVSK